MGSNDRSNSQRKGWGASAQPPPVSTTSTTSTNLNISVIATSTVPSMTPAEPVAAVPTDAALIAAWRGGDEPAAAELVRRHARALARFLAGAGAVAADVDDLVQEAFIRAFRGLGRFRGQCQVRTWLMTIGGNVLKDAHRRSRRSRLVPLGDDLRATDGDPHERAVAGEAERRPAAGPEQLPPLQRGGFLLRAPQGARDSENSAGPRATPRAARVHYHH